jgi:predicted kinase
VSERAAYIEPEPRLNTPVLLLMAGLPGSGKSTLAMALGGRLGWPVLDKDTVKSTLLELGAEEDLAARASYLLLDALARDLLVDQGLSVIVDSPTSYEQAIQAAQGIVAEAGGVLQIVLCRAPQATRARRLASRDPLPSHVVEIDQEAEDAMERVFDRLPEGAVEVETAGGSPEDVVEEIVSILQKSVA